VIPDCEVVDVGAFLDDDPGAFVSAENGERRHGDVTGHQVVIGVTKPGRLQLDLDLPAARGP
jgi:hypothetical protein